MLSTARPDFPITLLSRLIAIVVSGFALHTVSRKTLSRARLMVAAVVMGIGIAAGAGGRCRRPLISSRSRPRPFRSCNPT